MQTLFNGFDNLSDDEIRMQIALLSGVTVTGTVKGFFTAGSCKNTVMNIYGELSKLTRSDLNERLRKELSAKIRTLGSGSDEGYSDERLHILVVNEAGKAYRADDYYTPSQKFDLVAVEYYEHYLRVLKKRLLKLTAQEAYELELAIQKAIPRTDLEQMRQLAADLMLREFNGRSIRIKLMSDSTSQVLAKVIRVFGLGIFDAIEVVIGTCSDSVMMLCRMERILLAQCVWMAANGYGAKMAYRDDLMPSYSENLKASKKDEENEKEKYLLNLITREAKLNEDIKNTLDEIAKLNKQQVIAEEALLNANEKMTRLSNDFDDAQVTLDKQTADAAAAKDKYEIYLRLHQVIDKNDLTFRGLKQDYEGSARTIRNSKAALSGLEESIKKQQEIILSAKEHMDKINNSIGIHQEHLILDTKEFNQVIMDIENEADYRARIVEKRWKNYYKTITFDNRLFGSMVKFFTQREIVAIERLLREMDEAEDKSAFIIKGMSLSSTATANRLSMPQGAQNEITGSVYCYVRTGKYAQIEFAENVILNINVKGKS